MNEEFDSAESLASINSDLFAFVVSKARRLGVEPADVVQNAWVIAFQKFDPSRGSLRPLVFGIARNLLKWTRTGKATGLIDSHDLELPGRELSPDEILSSLEGEEVEALILMRKCIQKLPNHYREALLTDRPERGRGFVLIHGEQINASTFNVWRHRGLNLLRKLFLEECRGSRYLAHLAPAQY